MRRGLVSALCFRFDCSDNTTATFALNGNGMYRGYIKADENYPYTAIFDNDLLE
jgi:hypothetical protein